MRFSDFWRVKIDPSFPVLSRARGLRPFSLSQNGRLLAGAKPASVRYSPFTRTSQPTLFVPKSNGRPRVPAPNEKKKGRGLSSRFGDVRVTLGCLPRRGTQPCGIVVRFLQSPPLPSPHHPTPPHPKPHPHASSCLLGFLALSYVSPGGLATKWSAWKIPMFSALTHTVLARSEGSVPCHSPQNDRSTSTLAAVRLRTAKHRRKCSHGPSPPTPIISHLTRIAKRNTQIHTKMT
jgi:hypothetical protein